MKTNDVVPAGAPQDQAIKLHDRQQTEDLMRNAALPAPNRSEQGGKDGCIKDLLIRNARMNPGSGRYYELRHDYLSLDERETAETPVLMAGMSMLYSMLMDRERSEYWYEKLRVFADGARGSLWQEAQNQLIYLDIALPHRGSRDVLKILQRVPFLLLDRGVRLPEFSVTSNLPSTMNGGKDFCRWSPEDRMLARTVGPLVERVLGRYGKGLTKAALAESLYEKGADTYQVLTLLSQAKAETEAGGKLEIAFAIAGIWARLALVQGDSRAARELLDSFEQSVRKANAVQLLPNIQALRCRLALYEGALDTVEQWMETAPDEHTEFYCLERYRYLTKVRCYLATGEFSEAQSLLESLRRYAEQMDRPYIRMEAGLLAAIASQRAGRPWRKELRAVLREAETYRFLRLISEEGAAAWPLLQQDQRALLADGTLDQKWLRCLLDETKHMARRYPLYLKEHET